MPSKPKIIVVLGPTASGKSALAVSLAKKFCGEIISADSRQIYKNLSIGSGKITKSEMKNIPHHMLSIWPPNRTFSVADFQKISRPILKSILNRNKLPIICGGTGLFIDSLIHNTKFPSVKPNAKLRQKLESKSLSQLQSLLKKYDPNRYQKIDLNNPHRLIRSLEIVLSTGRPISPVKQSSPYTSLKIGLLLPKEKLVRNISLRTNKMLAAGLINEVKILRSQVSDSTIEHFGLIYRAVLFYLKELLTHQEMITKINQESLRYAKRQLTWFKRDPNIKWLENPTTAFSLVKSFLDRR